MDQSERLAADMAVSKLRPKNAYGCALQIQTGYTLFETERASIASAIISRRDEFATGRAAARKALSALGFGEPPIPRAADRRPIWPAGVVGTISHSGGIASALVAKQSEYAGIGLDIETAQPLKPNLHQRVLTPSERHILSTSAQASGVPRCMLNFVVKEAFYKAVYPISRKYFGFQEVSTIIKDDGTWSADFDPPAIGLAANLEVKNAKWWASSKYLIAVAAIVRSTE
ncbi:MAG: 4'-phosphopantetheinyl transferase superfamily protein [Pseudomonadota bacterium]